MDWITEDYTNKSKFDLVSSTWESLDALKDNPLKTKFLEKSSARQHSPIKRKWYHNIGLLLPRPRFVAVFASILLILTGLWMMQTDRFRHNIYKTAIGEQKTIQLADGSTVHLDTNTVVMALLSEQQRSIELQKGKALFTVVHDPDRPFIVNTAQVAIHAIGTEFSVYKRKKGGVAISVTEGRVKVTQKEENTSSDIKAVAEESKKQSEFSSNFLATKSAEPNILYQQIVESGQEIVVDDQNDIFQINPVDIYTVNAWQEGRLDFRNKPLLEVIEELNRYVENRIIIGDARLNDINVDVYFRLKNRKDFISTLKLALPIASHVNSKGQTILTKKEVG